MASAGFNPILGEVCPGAPIALGGVCERAESPIKVGWTVIDAPAGASWTIQGEESDSALFTADTDGSYTLRFTCYYAKGCDTADVILPMDCRERRESDTIQIEWKRCSPVAIDECPAADVERLVGSALTATTCPDDLVGCDTCGDEMVCPTPHVPVFFWNDVCCAGWEITASQELNGTSIYNTCPCAPGLNWQFQGPVTINFSGPSHYINTVIVCGHNMSSGRIFTYPYAAGGVTPRFFGSFGDRGCMPGWTAPQIINLSPGEDEPPLESVTEFTVVIEPDDPGVISIDMIFLGQKFFLPNDALEEGFRSPHSSYDFKVDNVSSNCGPLDRSVKHVEMPLDLKICGTEEWLLEEWRALLRYMTHNGVMFQWSRQRSPYDFFKGWVDSSSSGYWEDCEHCIDFSAKGHITQPQYPRYLPQ